MKTYGPYFRKDGRAHVIHIDGDTKRTESYPRMLMRDHLGRELLVEEHVDHINNDRTDNRIENLQLLSPQENARKSIRQANYLSFICPVCDLTFEVLERKYKSNQLKRGSSGPYCSKSCAGKMHN